MLCTVLETLEVTGSYWRGITVAGGTPILWRQELLSADPSNPSEDIRTLSLHAKAGWPQHWFQDRSLFRILFQIKFRSDHGSNWKEKQSPEHQGVIGVLRYCKVWQDSLTEESIDPCVGGYLSVSDMVFDELWERVKLRVALPCDIWIDVVGMTVDPSPAGDDYWDVNSQPKLTVVRVKFSFSTEQTKTDPALNTRTP